MTKVVKVGGTRALDHTIEFFEEQSSDMEPISIGENDHMNVDTFFRAFSWVQKISKQVGMIFM